MTTWDAERDGRGGGAPLEEWLEQRERVHHDWLRNTFLLRLQSRMDVLASDSAARTTLADEWASKRKDLGALLTAAEDALDPRQLIARSPISVLPPEERVRLAEQLHVGYLRLGGSSSLTAPAREALEAADAAVESLKGYANTAEDVGEVVVALADAVEELSRRISSLPRDVVLP